VTSAPVEQLRAALAERYRIERELGQGGMATVYLAHDLRHERKVAIKVLRPELAAVIGAERFVREIRTIAALQHPHILGLIDSGEVQGTAYYVMPFVEGESLRDRLTREKQLPIADAVRIATEVASALDYAHRHGVIHRDIKPENILLHDGQALVADFGIALAMTTAGGTRMTETGMSLGTPHYMSPEQAMGEREITARSDVYALGAVTYEMLSGEPPFTGPTAQAIVAKVMTDEPRPLTIHRKTVPEHVEAAVLTALAKLPADRFESAKQFAEALARPDATIRTTAVPRARPRRWSTRSLTLGSVAALALIGLGAMLARFLPAPPDSSQVTFTRKSFDGRTILNARFAPDGKAIVYSAFEHGTVPGLRIIRPEYPEPRRFGEDSTHLLAISSTGEMAVLSHARYLAQRIFTGTLARMPIGGGAPRDIVADVRDAGWSPDGTELALIRRVGGRDRLEYPAGHLLVETSDYLSDLQVSPHGDRLAYFQHPLLYDDRGRVVVVDRSGARTVLGPEFSALEGLAWLPDGKGILFAAAEHGEPRHVYRGTLAGTVTPVLAVPGAVEVHAVSSAGKVLLALDDQPWRIFVRPPGAAVEQDFSWLDGSIFPILSRDGSLFVFSDQSQQAGASYAAMMRKTDGSPVVRLGDGLPRAVSPDGRWVLSWVPTAEGRYELYPTGAGSTVRLRWPRLQRLGVSFEFFPDGRSLLVCGTEAGKAPRCYRSALEGGDLTPLTSDSVLAELPSPDGSSIVIHRRGQILVQPLRGGEARVVPGLKPEEVILRWSPDGRSLWVTTLVSPMRVEAVEVATGKRTPLITITSPERATISQIVNLSLADDPKVYAYSGVSWTSQLYLVDGLR
jgi:serine/threonine protein kinase